MDAVMVLVTRRENKCTRTIGRVFDEKNILKNSCKTLGYENVVKKLWATFCPARFELLPYEKLNNERIINCAKIIFFPKSLCKPQPKKKINKYILQTDI